VRNGRSNDGVVSLAREHGLLGMLVPVVHDGWGADMVTYARALGIGREGILRPATDLFDSHHV
jgi:hypothetical protein